MLRIMQAKRICIAAFVAVALAAFSGCSSKPSQGGIATLVYQTMETLPQQRAALEQLVRAFESAHPGIRVKIQTSPSGFTKLQAQMAAGDMPDVFYYVSDRLPALVHRGAVMDLQPFLARDAAADLSAYFPKAIESCKTGEALYCFPFHFSTDMLFYNKDLFDKTGLAYPSEDWTWDDFAKAAQSLTIAEGGTTRQYGTLQPRPLLLAKSYGGDVFQAGRCAMDSQAWSKGLEILQSLVRAGVAPQTAALRDIEVMDGVTLFSTGRVGMLVGRTYMLVEFGKLKDFDWDVALVPRGDRRYSRLAVGGNCIAAKTQHPQEAWEFVRFFSGPEGSKIMGAFRNCVPAHIATARSEIFLHAPPAGVETFIEALDSSDIENPGMILWQELVDKVIQPTVDAMLCGELTLGQALRDMTKKGQEFLREEAAAKGQ